VTLREKIVDEIQRRGPIPFSRYMELCLYDPDLGYYSRNAQQFGKAGDFYTSSDVHAVFGRLLARQFEEMWRALGRPEQIEILELGPGRGLFAQDVLDWSEKKFPEFFGALHYSLVEQSTALRERLEVTLDRRFSSGKVSLPQRSKLSSDKPGGTVETVPSHDGSDSLSSNKTGRGTRAPVLHDGTNTLSSNETRKGRASVVPMSPVIERALAPEVPLIVFANEFFDALPVEIVSQDGELCLAEKEGRFIETWASASAETLEFLDRHGVHPEAGERVEVSLLAQQYMSAITAAKGRAFVIVIDYGYTRAEQLAGRHRGTLTAYRQHSVSANPYEAPGEQDITAHVNFTALAAAAEENGSLAQPLVTQSQFLLGIGEHNQFTDAFEDCRVPQEHAKVALQLKHLVTPAGVGETFQVLVCSKGADAARLSGLSFGKSRL
jgi:SAM-dependent MidA family methyltransferase